MRKLIAIITTASFAVFPHAMAWAAAQSNFNSLWVQLCSTGQFISIDIGGDNVPPLPSHKSQACHAVCCKDANKIIRKKTKSSPQDV